MDFSEDVSLFFLPGGFSEEAVYNGSTIRGIFDKEYAQDDSFAAGAQGFSPVFICPASSVDAVPSGTIVIAEVSYTVLRGEPDGTGLTTLILMRA